MAVSPIDSIVLCFIWTCLPSIIQATGTVDLVQYTTDLINNRLLPADYNRNIRPNYGIAPLPIDITIMVNDISDISETSMSWQVSFYLRHFWNDHRLQFPVEHNVSVISLEDDFAHKIWFPDTFFLNSKSINTIKTFTSDGITLLRIASNGDITYSTIVDMLARCSMDLIYFPVDQQRCSIEMASYGKTIDEVVYNWKNDSRVVEFNSQINLPTFHLLGYSTRHKVKNTSTGSYLRLRLDIFFARDIEYYITQIYIPACLTVIISWIPFWLERNNSHARVGLGVTTVLTITTLITNAAETLPKVSHLTALDVYLFFCFILVFLALIEYATIGYYDDKQARTQEAKLLAVEENQPLDVGKTKVGPLCRDTSTIDWLARRLFPMCFIVFTVAYSATLYLIRHANSSSEIDVKLI